MPERQTRNPLSLSPRSKVQDTDYPDTPKKALRLLSPALCQASPLHQSSSQSSPPVIPRHSASPCPPGLRKRRRPSGHGAASDAGARCPNTSFVRKNRRGRFSTRPKPTSRGVAEVAMCEAEDLVREILIVMLPKKLDIS